MTTELTRAHEALASADPGTIALILDVPLLTPEGAEVGRRTQLAMVHYPPDAEWIEIPFTLRHAGRAYEDRVLLPKPSSRIVHYGHPGIVVEPARIMETTTTLRGEPVAMTRREYRVD